MESWKVALLTLLALLTGLMIPVLLQLWAALRELRKELRALGAHVHPIMEDAELTLRRVRRVTDGVEGREEDLAEIIHSARDLLHTVNALRGTTHVAAAAGAAVAAGVRAYRNTRHLEHELETEAEPPDAARPAPANGERAARDAAHIDKEMAS